MKQRILFVFKVPIMDCPRPRRFINTLKKYHDCFYACPPSIDDEQSEHHYATLLRKLNSRFKRDLIRWLVFFKAFNFAQKLESDSYEIPDIQDGEFDYIFVHELFVLPKFSSFKHSKVTFDAKEFHPLIFANDKLWKETSGKLNEYVCKKYMPKVYKVIATAPSHVSLYQEMTNRDVVFFPSFPRRQYYIEPQKKTYTKPLRFIYHGKACESRGLERMMDLMEQIGEGFSLDMMLVSRAGINHYIEAEAYFLELKERAESLPNVRIIPPVHPDQVIQFCSEYDMGLYLLEDNGCQNTMILPNKYFEFLFAGLPVITNVSVDMQKLTLDNDFGLGFSDEGLEVIADAIKNLTSDDLLRFQESIRQKVSQWNTENNIRLNLPELAVKS